MTRSLLASTALAAMALLGGWEPASLTCAAAAGDHGEREARRTRLRRKLGIGLISDAARRTAGTAQSRTASSQSHATNSQTRNGEATSKRALPRTKGRRPPQPRSRRLSADTCDADCEAAELKVQYVDHVEQMFDLTIFSPQDRDYWKMRCDPEIEGEISDSDLEGCYGCIDRLATRLMDCIDYTVPDPDIMDPEGAPADYLLTSSVKDRVYAIYSKDWKLGDSIAMIKQEAEADQGLMSSWYGSGPKKCTFTGTTDGYGQEIEGMKSDDTDGNCEPLATGMDRPQMNGTELTREYGSQVTKMEDLAARIERVWQCSTDVLHGELTMSTESAGFSVSPCRYHFRTVARGDGQELDNSDIYQLWHYLGYATQTEAFNAIEEDFQVDSGYQLSLFFWQTIMLPKLSGLGECSRHSSQHDGQPGPGQRRGVPGARQRQPGAHRPCARQHGARGPERRRRPDRHRPAYRCGLLT